MASWLDKMLGRVQDAKSLDEARKIADEYIGPDGTPKEQDDGDQHIHVHLPGSPGGSAKREYEDEDMTQPGGEAGSEVAQLTERVEALEAMIEKLMGEDDDGEDVELEDPDTKDARRYRMRRGKSMKSRDEDIPVPEREEEIVGKTDMPAVEDLDARMKSGDKKARDAYRKRMSTGDSADMEDTWKETVTAAAFIVPDIRVPTFDARLSPMRTAQRLCSFRRQVMDRAFKDADTADVIRETVGLTEIPTTLGCDSVKMAFNATASAIAAMNSGGLMRREATRTGTGDGKGRDSGAGAGSITIAEIQKRNREAWKTGEFKPVS